MGVSFLGCDMCIGEAQCLCDVENSGADLVAPIARGPVPGAGFENSPEGEGWGPAICAKKWIRPLMHWRRRTS